MNRRVLSSLVLVALLPAVTATLLVRPLPAESAEQAVGLYALTFGGASTATTGEVGAGGGLAVLDAGAPSVVGRLDSSPSGSVRAAPIEPGTLFRTVVGLANNEAGGETIPVPTADANFPGDTTSAEVEGTGRQEAGPLAVSGYAASATAEERRIAGVAETSDQAFTDGAAAGNAAALATGLRGLARSFPTAGIRVADDPSTYRTEGGRVEASATADPASGALSSTVTSVAGRTTVLGQLVVGSVVSSATVVRGAEGRTAEAATTVSGLTVGGVPVEVTDDGVVVADAPVLPGQTVADLTAALNEVLAVAGIGLTAVAPHEEVDDSSARARAGGLRITVATAPNPQVPGNDLTLVLGRADATLADEPPAAPLPSVPFGPTDAGTGGAPAAAGGGGASSGFSVGAGGFGSDDVPTAGTVAEPDVAAPAVAPTAGAGQQLMTVAGRPVSARTALAAFGGWQLLSLSICTLAAFSLRRGPEVAA